jgi:hypothetical protein
MTDAFCKSMVVMVPVVTLRSVSSVELIAILWKLFVCA